MTTSISSIPVLIQHLNVARPDDVEQQLYNCGIIFLYLPYLCSWTVVMVLDSAAVFVRMRFSHRFSGSGRQISHHHSCRGAALMALMPTHSTDIMCACVGFNHQHEGKMLSRLLSGPMTPSPLHITPVCSCCHPRSSIFRGTPAHAIGSGWSVTGDVVPQLPLQIDNEPSDWPYESRMHHQKVGHHQRLHPSRTENGIRTERTNGGACGPLTRPASQRQRPSFAAGSPRPPSLHQRMSPLGPSRLSCSRTCTAVLTLPWHRSSYRANG